MVEIIRGNLLEADAEALVNTVNCVGAMGKGIALQFKKAFPENFKAYRRACKADQVKPGIMFVHESRDGVKPKVIINFPTKRHWKGKSRLEDIESGLRALRKEIRARAISSIAIPPLGCGLGGLDWSTVRPMIETALADLAGVRVLLFEPTGAPDAKTMPVGTKRPDLTVARALLIGSMHRYTRAAYRLTLLEIHKLAYFIQEAGEPLRLKYEAGPFGPYAPNLNKVLEILEGHFTRGYGDTQKPDVEIDLLPGAGDEADRFLEHDETSTSRLRRIVDTIEGFENPYGMELLASTHWMARHADPPAGDADDAVRHVHRWSERKARMFRAQHIRIAWDRLFEDNWLAAAAVP